MKGKSNISSTRLELAKRVYRAFNALQQQNRFISISAGEVRLNRLENFVLFELQAKPDRSINDLAELLGFNRSSVSRAIASLEKKKLLRESTNPNQRAKSFSITSQGEKAILAIDETVNAGLERRTLQSSKKDAAEVVKLFRAVSEGLGEKRGVSRDGESAYRVEQRRITRALGLLGEHAYSTKLSHLSFHVLLLLAEHDVLTASQLGTLLNAQKAAMSKAIIQLEKSGLISREENQSDARSSLLSLEKEGRKLIEKTEAQTAKSLEQALSGVSVNDLKQFADSVERFSGLGARDKGLFIERLVSDVQRTRGRAFVIQELVNSGRESECPEALLPRSAHCFALLRKGEIIGVAQLVGQADIFVFSDSASKQDREHFAEYLDLDSAH